MLNHCKEKGFFKLHTAEVRLQWLGSMTKTTFTPEEQLTRLVSHMQMTVRGLEHFVAELQARARRREGTDALRIPTGHMSDPRNRIYDSHDATPRFGAR
jgi:hypothetical protein